MQERPHPLVDLAGGHAAAALAARVADPSDGRRQVIRLTGEGRAVLAGARRSRRAAVAAALDDLGEADARSLARVLPAFVAAREHRVGDPAPGAGGRATSAVSASARRGPGRRP